MVFDTRSTWARAALVYAALASLANAQDPVALCTGQEAKFKCVSQSTYVLCNGKFSVSQPVPPGTACVKDQIVFLEGTSPGDTNQTAPLRSSSSSDAPAVTQPPYGFGNSTGNSTGNPMVGTGTVTLPYQTTIPLTLTTSTTMTTKKGGKHTTSRKGGKHTTSKKGEKSTTTNEGSNRTPTPNDREKDGEKGDKQDDKKDEEKNGKATPSTRRMRY